jgi:hypothetical protein
VLILGLTFPHPLQLAVVPPPGIAECEVLKWFVAAGEPVKQFQKVCEVQSDKANVEITSRYDGTIKALHYKGTPLAYFFFFFSDDTPWVSRLEPDELMFVVYLPL